MSTEGIERDKATEVGRHNVATEDLTLGKNVTDAARLAEDVRQHLAREAETKRHNVAMELKPNSQVNVSTQPTINVNSAEPNRGSAIEVPVKQVDVDVQPMKSAIGEPQTHKSGFTGRGINRTSGFNGSFSSRNKQFGGNTNGRK